MEGQIKRVVQGFKQWSVRWIFDRAWAANIHAIQATSSAELHLCAGPSSNGNKLTSSSWTSIRVPEKPNN